MNYTSKYNNTNNICTIKVSGEYERPKDSIELEQLAIDFHSTHGYCLFLVDMSKAVINHGVISTYQTGNPPENISQKLIGMKAAFLYREITENVRFLEDVAVNRGLNMKVFDKLEEAVKWLK